MFGTIRKHQKWLWFVIIVLTIGSFVLYFNPANRGGGGGRGGAFDYGSIDGQPITGDEFNRAANDVQWLYFLQNRQWTEIRGGSDLEREVYLRLFQIRKVNENNIAVDDGSVARYATSLTSYVNQGQPITLDAFVAAAAHGHASIEDFARFVRDELAIEQLSSLVGLSGDMVTPQEAQSIYESEYRQIATKGVFFSETNYLAQVPEPSPQTVAEYYTNQMAAYRLPERVQAKYVAFSISNHLAEAEADLTNIAEIVDANMVQLGTNYVRYGKTPEEAKKEIRERIIHQAAQDDAATEAKKFISELFAKDSVRIESMEALARDKGLSVKTTKPFDQVLGPVEVTGETNYAQTAFNFAKAAFALTPEEPFSLHPVLGDDNVYVVALDKKLPTVIPPLQEIRGQVAKDYRRSEAVKLAEQAGEKFGQSLTNGLAHGSSFTQLCAAANITPISVSPFSMSTQELPEIEKHVDFKQFLQVALMTEPGHASEFVPTSDGGMIVFVQERLPIDQAKMSRELPTFLNALRQRRQQESANIWFQMEAGKAIRGAPFMNRKTEPVGSVPD